MSISITKVNFDRKTRKLYLLLRGANGFESLTLFRDVTVDEISKCYHSTRMYQSGADNFEQLEDFCPKTVLFSKRGPINGADQ